MNVRSTRVRVVRWSIAVLLVAAAAAAQTFNLQDTIPFDQAVRTATLPNGLTYFVRHNDRPATRVSLRLAVKAGSMNEADDQQGLAHFIEHLAFPVDHGDRIGRADLRVGIATSSAHKRTSVAPRSPAATSPTACAAFWPPLISWCVLGLVLAAGCRTPPRAGLELVRRSEPLL